MQITLHWWMLPILTLSIGFYWSGKSRSGYGIDEYGMGFLVMMILTIGLIVGHFI